MSALRVGLLGLDNSHPIVDLRNLARRREVAPVVLAEDGGRLDELRGEFGDLSRAADLDDLLARELDALIVTVRPSRLGALLGRVLDAGLPTFLNKPGFTTRSHWAPFDARVREASHLLTASVLRFAPKVVAHAGPRGEPPRGASIRVAHGIKHWQRPDNAWQSEPSDGGGVVGALIYHGVELAHAVSGWVPQPLEVERRSDARYVVRVAWEGGGRGAIELDASGDAEQYHVDIEQAGARSVIELDGTGTDPFGYAAAMDAFLRLCDGGQPPVDPAAQASVIDACVRVADIYETNQQ